MSSIGCSIGSAPIAFEPIAAGTPIISGQTVGYAAGSSTIIGNVYQIGYERRVTVPTEIRVVIIEPQ